ncbi:MAG TPA: hypothetical protein VIK14_07825 [Ignavibacteria bacterium]
MEKKKKLPQIQITELFLIKADWDRTYLGQILRENTEDRKSVVHGSVVVNEGKAWSSAETQDELVKYLDDLCVMKLDMGLHLNPGVRDKIFDTDFFLN